MCFEDGAVLGLCLSDPRISSKSKPTSAELLKALLNYEKCRISRTCRIVARGSHQGYLYHLNDGEEQEERDRELQRVPTREGEALVWRDPGVAPWLLSYDHLIDVSSILNTN
jgi:salicylate hydroxylase